MYLCSCFQVHNVQFAFELMQDAGLPKPKARAEGMFLYVLACLTTQRHDFTKLLSKVHTWFDELVYNPQKDLMF